MLLGKHFWLLGYPITIVTSLVAVLLSLLLSPLVPQSYLILFLAAIVVSSWSGIRNVSLLATIISSLAIAYFFLAPVYSVAVATNSGILELALFVAVGLLISFLGTARYTRKNHLQQSEQLLVRAICEAPIPIMLHAEDGQILQINQAWTQLTGYSTVDIPTISEWTQKAYGERQQLVKADIDRLYNLNTRVAEGEYIITTNSGETRIWDFYSAPLGKLPDGRRLVISTAIDITQRKQAEDELKQSYHLLQAVIEGTTDAVFVKNQQGRYTFINSSTARIFGRAKQEIIGCDDTELLPHNLAIALKEADRTIMQTGRGQVVEEQIFQDGSIHTYLSTKDPYRDTEGNIIGIISIARDITIRKQTLEALSRSLQRLETLRQIDRAILTAESTEDIARAALLRMYDVLPYSQAVVALFNFATGTADILAGSIDGVSTGENIQLEQLIPTFVPNELEIIRYVEDINSLQERLPLIEKQLQEGQRSFLAVSLVVQGELIGELIVFANQTAAFNEEHQQIAIDVANQLAVAIQQTRQRQQLHFYTTELESRVIERTAALEESNADMEAFTNSVSHDLREPVRVLQGFAQILLEDYAQQLDPVAQDFIERIRANAARMERLLQDLLAYSRLNRNELSLKPISLLNVVAEVLSQLESQIADKQAIVTVEEPLLAVVGHYTTLVQVVVNLLSNAIKFVVPGVQPRVRLWAEQGNGWVRLWVEDNGIGVEPKHQVRIFKVFERLHAEEVYLGTGIGLAIVRRGIERMGGQVGIESTARQGSRFWILLPYPSGDSILN
ncbi:PAS domain S-box protein [Nostoc sp. UIC 10630]|uniref:PAS domain S-box protein n=1 Tax=Nostoc sp. UIC 10630 TaxID=2100146 RepID=UPI0013D1541F|nr:PAS domain S-box protein [Nostoc sp. UIC 10630]NEU82835.1 PAS domain S-box protein [Nostoc sp. UIC 10630]